MSHHLNNIVLDDRILWYDGDISINEDTLLEYISSGIDVKEHVYVDEITENIKKYNSLLPECSRLTIKTELKPFDLSLVIPEKYKYMSVRSYIYKKLLKSYETDEYIEQYISRVDDEYMLYKKHGLINFLRILIYISDVMKDKDIVHGVGRGSCVASFILYIIGIHRVNSVYYDLDITEFLLR